MKAAFSAEAIGLGIQQETDILHRMSTAMCAAVGVPAAGLLGDGPPSMNPWVAEIVGRDERYGLARVFLNPKRDYRETNSKATRGVWFWWTLESGRIYETRYRESWGGGFTRKFIRVTDVGEIEDVDREEVERWLNEASASTF